MGFYRTAEAHEKAIRERARYEWLQAVIHFRKLQQAREDAWYEKFQQAQAQRKGSE